MVLVLLLFTACAGLQQQATVSPEKGEKVLAMKAGSFKFEPNNIKAFQEDVILFKVENISDIGHNFTIRDPGGQIIQNVDLPPKETIEIRVPLPEIGIYTFYCNKTFHKLLGMKGQIEVLRR
jgi:plastocyanin